MVKGGYTPDGFSLSVDEYLDECPSDINRMAQGFFQEIEERIHDERDGYYDRDDLLAYFDRMVETFEKAKTLKRFKTPLNDEMKAKYDALLEYRKELA